MNCGGDIIAVAGECAAPGMSFIIAAMQPERWVNRAVIIDLSQPLKRKLDRMGYLRPAMYTMWARKR